MRIKLVLSIELHPIGPVKQLQMRSLENIFESLVGAWSLDRTIIHIELDQIDTAKGIAVFLKGTPTHPDTLFYEENGQLTLDKAAKAINFKRKYIYKMRAESIDIILNDGVTKGTLFQTLTPQQGNVELTGSEHLCRLDKHSGKHFFQNEHNFETEYTVLGPNTNLFIKTCYQRS